MFKISYDFINQCQGNYFFQKCELDFFLIHLSLFVFDVCNNFLSLTQMFFFKLSAKISFSNVKYLFFDQH